MDTKQLQEQIKTYQNKLSWTHIELANALYVELFDDDDLEMQLKFNETLKKQLQRTSTSVDKLKRYLQIIEQSPEFKKLHLVTNKYIETKGLLSKNVSSRLHKLSKKLTDQLQGDEFISESDEF